MTTVTGSFRGGKRVDPRPWKQKSKPKDLERTWPKVLQLNIEGFTANKISILSQLAIRHKALVILLQEKCRPAVVPQLFTSRYGPQQEARPGCICP